jgi:hypothetical protein
MLLAHFFFGGSGIEQAMQKAVKRKRCRDKQNIQHRDDHNVKALCGNVANRTLEAQPQRLQRCNVAGIEVVVIRLQKLRHSGGYDAETQHKEGDGFMGSFLRRAQIKPQDYKKLKDHNIVKYHGVEGQKVFSKTGDVPSTVYQTGIDEC